MQGSRMISFQSNDARRFHLATSLNRPWLWLVLATVITATGCLPMLDRIAYVIRGTDIPAPYDKLAGKRTAIVCLSEASAFGPDSVSNAVTRMVGATLLAKVKKIQIVPTLEIEKWVDENDWEGRDYLALGKGVKADRLIAIEISNYSIHEGKTLHKGRINVAMTVFEFDGKKGPVVGHTYRLSQYEFPKNGRPSIQSTDREFESFFLARVCRLLTNQFVKHDRFDSVADEAMLGN
jgi:hypothetical protein